MVLGPIELVAIVGAVVLLFGAHKIPELARSIGRAEGEFRDARQGDEPDEEVNHG